MGIQSKRKYSSDEETTHSKGATTSTMRQLSLLLLLSAAMLCSASTLRVKRGVNWRRTCRGHSQCGPFQACSQRKCVDLCFSDDCNKEVNSARDWFGWTPLHQAADENNGYVAKLLLENSANVDSPDWKYGRTALHYAADSNSVDVAKLLL